MLDTRSFHTERLFFRPPAAQDARPIFERYAGDPEVARYLAWPRHKSVKDSEGFIAFSDSEWARWPAGPLLIFSRASGELLGGSGLMLETTDRAVTGYVLARDAWGQGYATEALGAMVELASKLRIARLYAFCHTEHRASWRVMEKCGFTCEGVLPCHSVFPNLSPDPLDVFSYVRILV